MMDTLRAFFAIKPPLSMHNFLMKLLKRLIQSDPKHSVKWIRLENLHITLQFIKSIQINHVDTLIEQVRAELKNPSAIQLQFGNLEWFPGLRHPKALSLAVAPHAALNNLAVVLGQAISAINYPVEARPFRGHMSLGRLTHARLPLVTHLKLSKIPPVLINEFYLIESKDEQGKTVYLPLAQFNLY